MMRSFLIPIENFDRKMVGSIALPYLNPKYNQPPNPSRSIMNFENQHSLINFSPHIFETSTIIEEQKHTCALLTSTNIGFHTFQGPLGSENFLV